MERKTVFINLGDGEESRTFLKPFSGEWDNGFFVITENAFGGFYMAWSTFEQIGIFYGEHVLNQLKLEFGLK